MSETYKTVIDITGTELTPNHPELCKGNGKTLDESEKIIECCCDECDYFLGCFPEYKTTAQKWLTSANIH